MAITELSHLIQYRCVNREHLRLNEQDRVFVHTDGWAYCPGGRRAADHEFLPTGGLDRRRLERGVVQQRSG